MKKLLITLGLMLTAGLGVSMAETPTDGWELGLGLSYPQYSSVNVNSLSSDMGAYLSIQRNFSEHVGLRLKGGYSILEGQWYDTSMNTHKETTDLLTADLDLVYYLVPCEPVTPYVFAGFGGNFKQISNGQTALSDSDRFGAQLNLGGGAEFRVNSDIGIVAEASYHVTNNSDLDGTVVPAEMNAQDSYLLVSAGVNFAFGKGGSSKQCENCGGTGSGDMTDYSRIENIFTKHTPCEIVPVSTDTLVLVGVNFAFDKSALLPESYAVLDKAVVLLKKRPEVKIEIEGYTDYVGTPEYNHKLSIERAEVVKAYLVSNGIAANRLTTVGHGENNALEDNKTDGGRAMNRRIVFKTIK
jgi:hypothetical protein